MGEALQSEPILRLYEYEEIKPPLDESILEHHGILRQKWGVRNGPPYPLDSSISTGKRLRDTGSVSRKNRKLQKRRVKALKKARKTREANQEAKKTKEEIIKSKDIVSMYNHLDWFSRTEIEEVLKRISAENRLKEEVEKKTSTPVKRVINIAKKGIAKGGQQGFEDILSTVTKNGMKVAAKTGLTSAVGERMANQLLPGGGGGKKKNKKNKKKKKGGS